MTSLRDLVEGFESAAFWFDQAPDLMVSMTSPHYVGSGGDAFRQSAWKACAVLKDAGTQFKVAASVLDVLDVAVTRARAAIDAGTSTLATEIQNNPFLLYNQTNADPYAPVAGFSVGQSMIDEGARDLVGAYEEAAAQLEALATTSPSAEDLIERHYEAVLKKKGISAQLSYENGELVGIKPKWDDDIPFYRPIKRHQHGDRMTEILQTVPGGQAKLDELHKKYTSGWRGFFDPTYAAANANLYAYEGKGKKAAFYYVMTGLSMPTPAKGAGVVIKSTEKGVAKLTAKEAAQVAAKKAAVTKADDVGKQFAKLPPPPKLAGPASRVTPTAPGRPASVVAASAKTGSKARFIDIDGTIIDRVSISQKISVQKQGRHILGDKLHNGGGYFRDPKSAQAVLDAFHNGRAEILGVSPSGNIVVRVASVKGFNNNVGKEVLDQATDVFFIKGSTRPSVVPANPHWRPR